MRPNCFPLIWLLCLVIGPLRGSFGADTQAAQKYLLYDVRPGEGFNLQKEIFIRASNLVGLLNKRDFHDCKEEKCARWTVVLPPWCYMAHWKQTQDALNWVDFFDLEYMNDNYEFPKAVMEYWDYRNQHGSEVDMSITLTHRDPPTKRWQAWGEVGDCADLEQMDQFSDEGTARYSGYCDYITPRENKCIFSWGIEQNFVVQHIPTDSSVHSVWIRNMDRTSGPHDDAYHLYRKLLLPAKSIISRAENFIHSEIGTEPYIAAHVRRKDFPDYARIRTTPTLSNASKYLLNIAETHNINTIFIATDGTKKEKKTLRKGMEPIKVVFLETKFGHPGINAVVEQWIATQADHFVGTQESRYTLQIQEERTLMGKEGPTTWVQFCGKEDPDPLARCGPTSSWFSHFPAVPDRERFLLKRDTHDNNNDEL